MAERSAAPAGGQNPWAAGTPAPTSTRWLVLAVIGVSQLMVVLDLTVMNLALPSAQHALEFTNADRQWVVTAYALSFGSLLLFGGRLADLVGHKVIFLTGLIGFAAASAVGGASVDFAMLVTARACQGVFAALLAPAALALLVTTFTDPAERGKAFGVFGAIAASGAALGLLLGGVLTSYLSWRWCMYVNVAFSAITIAGGVLFMGGRRRIPGARLDLPGVLTGSSGMFCLVYGFSNAATHSWRAAATWAFLVAGVVLLVVFTAGQARAAQPLLPLRIVLDRNRGGAYLTILLAGAGMFGIFLFLLYYMQLTLGYSPVVSGVAMLPMVVVSGTMANIGNIRLMPRVGPKPLVFTGMLLNAVGMVWLTRIGLHSGYPSALLGPLVVSGAGMGLIFASAANTGTFGVAPRDAGAASAVISTAQQLGGAIGTALLNTIATSAAAAYLVGHQGGRSALTAELATLHGTTTVFWWCAGIFAAGAVLCGALLRRGPLAQAQVAPAPEQSRQAASA